MMHGQRYPALEQFLGGYFHQDWYLEASDWEGVVRNFCAAARREHVEAVIADLESLLGEAHDEQALKRIVFSDFGGYYDPSVSGTSLRDWLIQLHGGLVASLPAADS